MAQYSGIWTVSQVSQAVKAQNWTGIAPPVVEYLVVAGGGAGTVGINGIQASNISGSGGAGIASSINGTVTTYAGGGGGGAHTSPAVAGNGGVGGGGAGAITGGATGGSGSATGGSGTANTGGGGGGAAFTSGSSGSGGSGIVIIRYPNIYKLATSTTGSPTQTTANGFIVYTFTASGSITF